MTLLQTALPTNPYLQSFPEYRQSMRNLMAHISKRETFFCRMRPLGDICKKRRKLFRLSKNDIISNCSTDSPVTPIVSGEPPVDAKFNCAYFRREAFFCRMRPFGDICKKRRKLFRLSKNDITSNCSTNSPVTPIVSGVPQVDA